MTLLDQYLAGDCKHVWQRIVNERRPSTDSEALAVAHETVRRARENLCAIHERLVELGYDFAEPSESLVTTSPEEAANEISEFESQYGALPGLARIWYSHLHSVNFRQARTQCTIESDHILRNLGWYPQAMYLSLAKCRELAAQKLAEYREWYETMQSLELDDFDASKYLNRCHSPDEMARFLPMGSCASNCEHKGFTLPCELMDTKFSDDGDENHFNEDLRYVILSGGFPILASRYRDKVPEVMRLGHPDPESLLAFLTRDLQPI